MTESKKPPRLVFVLFTIMESTSKYLIEEDVFSRLPKGVQNDIITEFLIFYLHQFNRTFFAWLGENKRNELMDDVLVELLRCCDQKSREELSKSYDQLSIETFGKYLRHLSSQTKNLLDLYNRREEEYSKYSEEPEKGKGLAGTVLWEFGNRIARKMNRENDIVIIMKAQLLGTGWTHFADAMKQVVLEDKPSV